MHHNHTVPKLHDYMMMQGKKNTFNNCIYLSIWREGTVFFFVFKLSRISLVMFKARIFDRNWREFSTSLFVAVGKRNLYWRKKLDKDFPAVKHVHSRHCTVTQSCIQKLFHIMFPQRKPFPFRNAVTQWHSFKSFITSRTRTSWTSLT